MDGELPGVEHRQVHTHLIQCEACRDEYDDLLQMKRMLSGLRIHDAGASLQTVILQRLDEAETRHPAYRIGLLLSAMKRLSGSAIAPPVIGLSFGLTAFIVLHLNQQAVANQNEGSSQKMTWSLADTSKDSFRNYGMNPMQTREPNRFLVEPIRNVNYSLTYKSQNRGFQSMPQGYIDRDFNAPTTTAGVQWFRSR